MSSEQVNQASIPEATVANSLIKDQPSVEARKAMNQDIEMDTASSELDSALPAPATSQEVSTSTYKVCTTLFAHCSCLNHRPLKWKSSGTYPEWNSFSSSPHQIQLTHLRETVDVMARRITSQEGYIKELEGTVRTGWSGR